MAKLLHEAAQCKGVLHFVVVVFSPQEKVRINQSIIWRLTEANKHVSFSPLSLSCLPSITVLGVDVTTKLDEEAHDF